VLKSCPAGYVFRNTSSDSNVFSSIYQQCTQCLPSYFCLGGTSEALACPSGTYSYAGSQSLASCITVSFVSLTVSMAMSRSDFNSQRQSQYKAVLANSSGTTVDHIVIASISGSRRATTSSSITVTSIIATDNAAAAAALVNHFDTNALESGLTNAGFPSPEVQAVQVVENNKQGGQDNKVTAAVAPSLVGTAVACAVAYIAWRIVNAPASKRLLSAKYGQPADQRDLPGELRKKYEAVKVVGSGAYGVVIEAWQVSSGKRTVRRAIKLVHARTKKFTAQELRRLDREVICKSFNDLKHCLFN
jgi:hypothetical protein